MAGVMPELIQKSSIVGKSYSGITIVAFDTLEKAKNFAEKAKLQNRRIRFYEQTVFEKEIEL